MRAGGHLSEKPSEISSGFQNCSCLVFEELAQPVELSLDFSTVQVKLTSSWCQSRFSAQGAVTDSETKSWEGASEKSGQVLVKKSQ